MGHSNTDETVPEHNFKQQTGQVQPNVETYEFPLRTSKESLCKRPTRLQTPFCSSSHKFCCCTHANQLGDDDLNRVRASEIISRVSAVCWMLTEPRQIIKEKKIWKKKKNHKRPADLFTNDWVRNKMNLLVRPQEPLLATVKRRTLAWFGHVTLHDSLFKIDLQGTLED